MGIQGDESSFFAWNLKVCPRPIWLKNKNLSQTGPKDTTIGISESNTIHSEQPPKLNTYEGEQTQHSFVSANTDTGSISGTQQTRSLTVNEELLNMDMYQLTKQMQTKRKS